jgi:hypothetical protein
LSNDFDDILNLLNEITQRYDSCEKPGDAQDCIDIIERILDNPINCPLLVDLVL